LVCCPIVGETFRLSTDPQFVAKTRDIVGLDLDPPTKAIVLYVNEKSQIQALDRTRPYTHYEHHGTKTLFAALDIATGKVIGELRRERSIWWGQALSWRVRRWR
jgi:hypothetical protein